MLKIRFRYNNIFRKYKMLTSACTPQGRKFTPGWLIRIISIYAEKFLYNSPSALVLGDNIFYGHSFIELLNSANTRVEGATIFAYHVHDPERYGVVEFDQSGRVVSLEEKPEDPRSNYAVTGLYFYDDNAVQFAKQIKPSQRGELEITDLNRMYLEKETLFVEVMGRGYAWLDTGTHESLLNANQFVQTIEVRQGLKIACPEEIAFRRRWINEDQLEKLAETMFNNNYGQYLIQVLEKDVFYYDNKMVRTL